MRPLAKAQAWRAMLRSAPRGPVLANAATAATKRSEAIQQERAGVFPMQRRQFIALLAAPMTAGPRLSFAQAEKIRRLAIASPIDRVADLSATGLPHFQALFERMHSHGYVEGQNLL